MTAKMRLEDTQYYMRPSTLTILHLANPSLEVVDAEVADLVANVVPIHGCGLVVVKCVMFRADYRRAAMIIVLGQTTAAGEMSVMVLGSMRRLERGRTQETDTHGSRRRHA